MTTIIQDRFDSGAQVSLEMDKNEGELFVLGYVIVMIVVGSVRLRRAYGNCALPASACVEKLDEITLADQDKKWRLEQSADQLT